MRAVAARSKAALAWAEARLEDLRSRLTPGQRWTSALALALAVAVLLFGLPDRVVVVEPRPGELRAASDAAAAEAQPGVAIASELDATLQEFAALVPDAAEDLPFEPGEAEPAIPVQPEPVPRVVALVRTDTAVPNRDDGALAKVFVDRAGFAVTTMRLDPADAGLCAKVVAAGEIAMASRGLDATLRDCLVSAGVVVVAFDDQGDLPAGRLGRGQVVSTRRGAIAALLDLGRWGVGSGALGGRVGVVSTAAAKAQVEPSLAALSGLGVDVVASAYLGDAVATTEVMDGVRGFAAKRVEVVLFVAPVEHQRRWVGHQAVLGPAVRYLVVDAFDTFVDETYPPSFDGATARTSTRVPWFRRDRGETPAQAFCRQQWESVAAPGTLRAGEETFRVFSWCQDVALVAATIRAVEGGAPLAAAVRSQAVVSPLTSDLGPLLGGGYGPVEDAVVVWRSSCTCWKESQPFTPRG